MIANLPREVYEVVSQHLRTSARRAHRNWEINQAHEDSLTGAAFADFTTRRTRRIYVGKGEWRWRVKAYKFGSGGKGSQERRMGADGIVEIEVLHRATGNLERKSLLVQAKKQWAGRDNRLLDQVKQMEALASGSSAAIDYSPGGYVAVEGRDIVTSDGNRNLLAPGAIMPLGDFLADQFLACRVGVNGLYYDPRRKLLNLPPTEIGPEAVECIVPQRLRVEIEEILY